MTISFSYKDIKGENYEDVIELLEQDGFVNITTEIYANHLFVSYGLDLAQGLAIGMLFAGILMSSRYGAKIRAFKRRIFMKNKL